MKNQHMGTNEGTRSKKIIDVSRVASWEQGGAERSRRTWGYQKWQPSLLISLFSFPSPVETRSIQWPGVLEQNLRQIGVRVPQEVLAKCQSCFLQGTVLLG